MGTSRHLKYCDVRKVSGFCGANGAVERLGEEASSLSHVLGEEGWGDCSRWGVECQELRVTLLGNSRACSVGELV